jgi:hypothetical protein
VSETTFVAACLAGQALLTDVDDWIDEWHESEDTLPLDEFLGFHDEEGALFAERPEALRFIVAARRLGKPVNEVLLHPHDFALAARASDAQQAKAVLDWLKETGRLQKGG